MNIVNSVDSFKSDALKHICCNQIKGGLFTACWEARLSDVVITHNHTLFVSLYQGWSNVFIAPLMGSLRAFLLPH